MGTAILTYTMFVSYSKVVEGIGFFVLAFATWIDYDLRRWSKVTGGKKTGTRHQRQPNFEQNTVNKI